MPFMLSSNVLDESEESENMEMSLRELINGSAHACGGFKAATNASNEEQALVNGLKGTNCTIRNRRSLWSVMELFFS